MTDWMRFHIVLALCFGLSAGCTRDPDQMQDSRAEAESSADASAGTGVSSQVARADAAPPEAGSGLWLTLPAHVRLPGLAKVETAPSWDARVADLPQMDQAYLAEVSDRYFGAVEFQDEAEQRQLIRQGFPMPEEWLAARRLSYPELERLIEHDNTKAKMFYIDRVSQEIGPILARGDGLKLTPEGRALLSRFARARLMADNLLQSTRSPFAAYLAGRIAAAGTFGTPPEMFAGTFEMAKNLGHERASVLQSKFFAAHPDMDASIVMLSYSSLNEALKQ